MDFIDLYRLAQDIINARESEQKSTVIVPVADLKGALIAGVSWLSAINIHPISTEPGDPLGHYECHSETESHWDDADSWVALITYDSTLNECGKRFVWCKELMHIFDTEDGRIKTDEEYRGLLTEIEIKPIEPSLAYLSENQAKWLALLVLCPKIQRDRMKAKARDEGLSDYDIALTFRIPQQVVSSLFSDYYDIYYNRFAVG